MLIPARSCARSGATSSGGIATTNAPEAADARRGRRASSPVGDPLLEGAVEVTLADGTKVPLPPGVRPAQGVRRRTSTRRRPRSSPGRRPRPSSRWPGSSPKQPGTTLFAVGMGPNQFFNNDHKDRDTFLLAALTGNIGHIGGNVGSLRRQLPRLRSSTARRSGSTRTRSTSSSTRRSRRGRSSTGRPSRPTTATTRTTRCASATSCSPARRTCRRRPSRSGSPTPTRSSATSSGTSTRRQHAAADRDGPVNEWWWTSSCE